VNGHFPTTLAAGEFIADAGYMNAAFRDAPPFRPKHVGARFRTVRVWSSDKPSSALSSRSALYPAALISDGDFSGDLRNAIYQNQFHNKMETISRVAYGFGNFENYRRRVKVLCS
jgi:hypothetical protein